MVFGFWLKIIKHSKFKCGIGLKFIPKRMEKDEAYQISEWRYEPPYSFYNLNADLEDLQEFLDFKNRPENKYFSVFGNSGDLVGFYEFTHKEDCIEMGLGMRPDLTGRGLGLSFVKTGIEFIRLSFVPEIIRLQVLSSNERAKIVYERAGFKSVKKVLLENDVGKNEFIEMELNL